MTARVRTDMQGKIAIVHMDDGKVNAINQQFLDDLNAAFDRAEAEHAEAVVLTGREGYFSAGLDLKTLPGLSADDLRATLQCFGETMIRLSLFPRPVVAAVTGHAIAGGCVLALTADRRVLANGPYRVGLNEVAIGITLPTIVIDLAVATLPAPIHAEAVLHGRLYVGAEAEQAGYVETVVDPPDTTLAHALGIAGTLAALPADSYRNLKQTLRGRAIADGQRRLVEELDMFVGAFK